jgi:hypothetical protein
MMPSPSINDCARTNRSRRRSTGNACARAKPPILPADPPQTSPRNAPPAPQSPYSPAERSLQPLQSRMNNAVTAAKSP